jgi:hypothetical protein
MLGLVLEEAMEGKKSIPPPAQPPARSEFCRVFFFAKTTRGHTSRRCGSRVGKLPERQRNLDSGQAIAQSAKCSNCVPNPREGYEEFQTLLPVTRTQKKKT